MNWEVSTTDIVTAGATAMTAVCAGMGILYTRKRMEAAKLKNWPVIEVIIDWEHHKHPIHITIKNDTLTTFIVEKIEPVYPLPTNLAAEKNETLKFHQGNSFPNGCDLTFEKNKLAPIKSGTEEFPEMEMRICAFYASTKKSLWTKIKDKISRKPRRSTIAIHIYSAREQVTKIFKYDVPRSGDQS